MVRQGSTLIWSVFINSKLAECRTDESSHLHTLTNRRNLSCELKLLAACKSLVARRALSFLLALTRRFAACLFESSLCACSTRRT